MCVCTTYFLANRLLSFSSISLSVEEDGVVLADVLTGDAGGSTFTAVPTFGALATLCKPSRLWAPGGAKWLPFVMYETSIWLMELCRRLRLLSPTKFNMNIVLDNCQVIFCALLVKGRRALQAFQRKTTGILMIAILPFKGSITSQRISCIFLVDRIIELLTTRTGVNAMRRSCTELQINYP